MDLIEYRAVIKFFVKEVYGDSSPSFSRIKKWAAEFKRGRTSLEDDPREGCPKIATTPEIFEQVHDMVLDDWRMKVHEIAQTIGISKERRGYILHEELDMKKFCARWVPRLLTADQKTYMCFYQTTDIDHEVLTLRRLMSYIYGAPILDVSRSHTTTQHSR